MTINITPHTTIRNFQYRFQREYPFLKIKFADKAHSSCELIKDNFYNEDCKLSGITKYVVSGEVNIKPWKKTVEVEESLEKKFGLHAQIFRRNGYEFAQTAGTDALTLFEQNEIGRKSVEKSRSNLWFSSTCLL